MPDLFLYIYIKYLILKINFLNEPEPIFFTQLIKWKVRDSLRKAKVNLDFKEINRHIQTGRQG